MLAQPGEEVAQKWCTVILYSSGSLSILLLSHQKKQRKLQCSGLTWTWWKMPSISHMTATGSGGNLHNTSTMLFVSSRPWRRCLLRIRLQFPRYSRKQLLSFPAFLGDTLHGAECTTRVDYLFKLRRLEFSPCDVSWWYHSWRPGNLPYIYCQTSAFLSVSWDVSERLPCCYAT